MASTIGLKCLFLKNHGEGTLTRLHAAKAQLTNNKELEKFKQSSKELGKVIKKLVDTFPNEPKEDMDKIPGYDNFKTKESEIRQAFSGIYEAVLSVVDYKSNLLTFLGESKLLATARMDENPLIVEGFLTAVTLYFQMLFHVRELTLLDLRTVVVTFAHACRVSANDASLDFTSVCQLMVEVEKHGGIKHQPHVFEANKEASDRLGEMAVHVASVHAALANQTQKGGLLNPLGQQELATLPLPSETYLDHMLRDKFEHWVPVVFALFPGSLVQPGALEALRSMLGTQYAFPLWREHTIEMHELMDVVFDKYDRKGAINLSKKKSKAFLEEACANAVTVALNQRMLRRTELLHEATTLFAILRDQPGLLGPKAEMAMCCLSMIRQEVMWFFRHQVCAPPTIHKAQKKVQSQFLKDTQVVELIHLSMELQGLMQKHKHIIQAYYCEYMGSCDVNSITDLIATDPAWMESASLATPLNATLKTLKSIKFEGGALEGGDLEEVRKHMYVVQGLASTPLANKQSIAKQLCKVTMGVLMHSRFVDDWDWLIREHASLGGLLFFWERYQEMMITDVLKGEGKLPGACISFIKVFSQATIHAHPHCPEEQVHLGAISQEAAKRFMTMIFEIVNKCFLCLFQQLYTMDMVDVNPSRVFAAKKRLVMTTPGAESICGKRSQLPMGVLQQNTLVRMLDAIAQNEELTVYSTVFRPKEYVRELVTSRLRSLLRSKITEKPPMLRPSDMVAQVHVMVRCCSFLSQFLHLDFESTLRMQLLREICDPTVDILPKTPNRQSSTTPDKVPLITAVCEWLLEFALRNDRRVVIAGNGEGFLGFGLDSDNIQRFLDGSELQALATVLGPYGVLAIDEQLKIKIRDTVEEIKGYLKVTRSELSAMHSQLNAQGCVGSAHTVWHEARKFREKRIDNFVASVMALGRLLSVRRVILAALSLVVKQRAGFISGAVSVATGAYFESASKLKELAVAERLAALTRVNGDTDTDVFVRETVASHCTNADDEKLWALLPVALAVSFVSHLFRDKQPSFSVQIGAHGNNAQCLVAAINALASGLTPPAKAIVSNLPTSRPEAESRVLLEYVRMGGALVLAMRSQADVERDYQISDMVLLLHKVVSQSRMLESLGVETFLPFSLVRSCLQEAYNRAHGLVAEPDERESTATDVAI